MNNLDFLAVGDIVTEPFIKLKDAHVNCTLDTHLCEISMRFGDKIPYESSTLCAGVGNASNAAVSAARLGLSTALRAYIGDDRHGIECLDVLKSENIDTSFMVTEAGKKTNYHYVLWFESERTILVKHEEFSYTAPELTTSPTWMYLSSLADNSLPYHAELAELLANNPDIKLAFQPGTFQMKLGVEALKGIYARTEIFFCNVEEAGRILGTPDERDIPTLLKNVSQLGPKIVAITDGTNGGYAYDGTRMMRIPMYPDVRGPYERTGAGDAFASTVVAALILGEPLEKALLWGPINSMSVVQEVGAQKGLLTREQLLKYLEDAPESYKITAL